MSSIELWSFVFAAVSAVGSLVTVFQFGGIDIPLLRRIQFFKPTIGTSVLLSMISLVLSSVGFYNSLTRGTQPIGALLVVGDLLPTDLETPFIASRQTRFNVTLANVGPQPNAEDVSWQRELFLQPIPISNEDERKRYDEFKRSAAVNTVGDLSVQRKNFSTLTTRQLSEQDVRDIREGRLRVYFFSFIKYRDTTGSHTVETCSYIQPPADRPVFSTCQGVPQKNR